jgi:TonB-linked SusC/RagA family outer membrane protein
MNCFKRLESRLKICLMLTGMLLSTSVFGQQIPVTGTVADESGETLPGVNVMIKGTTQGVTTDVDGKFSINVPNGDAVLQFTFIGYTAQDVTVGDRRVITVTMAESATALDEVVVIGYGSVAKRDITGAVSTLSSKTLMNIPTTSVAEAMSGRMPGVQVTTNDGSPDAEIRIRVRGGGSITQDNSPLYVVDGFQVSSMRDIDPNEIEDIVVLKDASSTAIYGARGANGVVLITTKSGKAGKTVINFNSYFSVATLAKKLDVMDPYEYVLLNYEIAAMNGSSQRDGFIKNYGDPEDYYIYKGQKGYDWQEDVFGRNPISQNYSLSITGGTEKTRYSMTLTHVNEQGVQVASGTKRTNANFRLMHDISDKVKIEINSRFVNRIIDGSGTGGASVTSALQYKPTNGLREFSYIPEEDLDPEEEEANRLVNPSEQAYQNYREQKRYQFFNTAALSWEFLPGLTYRGEFGFDFNFSEDNRFYGPESGTSRNDGKSLPLTDVTRGRSPDWRIANTLNYRFKLKERHSFNVLVGQEVLSGKSYSNYSRVTEFPIDIQPAKAFANAAQGLPNRATSSESKYDRTASVFGRINYSFANKYIAQATFRADGSSKFAPGKQWGYFPAGSVAWIVSEEDFLKSVAAVSMLKARVSLGQAGNNRIGDDQWIAQYSPSKGKFAYGEVQSTYYAHANSQLPNPDIKWETTITRNAGIDFGLFRSRINGTVDVYWNSTRDLLVPIQIGSYSGYSQMYMNAGETSNRGVELDLTGVVAQRRDLFLSVNFNIGINKLRVDKIAAGIKNWSNTSGWASTDLLNTDDFRMEEGKAMGLVYGYVTDGFYTFDDFTYDDVAKTWNLNPGVANSGSMMQGTLMPGKLKIKDIAVDDSDTDEYEGKISSADRTVIANTNPKFSGGFGVTAQYKGFDFAAYFNFMYGFDVYNANKIYHTTRYTRSEINMMSVVDSHHRFRYFDDAGNDLRNDPAALAELNKNADIWNPSGTQRRIVHSWAMEDGSFLRLQTLTLGYTIPESITGKIGISRLRFYVSSYNTFLWTRYSGYDPEVNIQTGLTPGIDNNIYPRARTFVGGINLSF